MERPKLEEEVQHEGEEASHLVVHHHEHIGEAEEEKEKEEEGDGEGRDDDATSEVEVASLWNIVDMPHEVWLLFLVELRARNIGSLLCTCRALSDALDSDAFFKALYCKKFGRLPRAKGKGARKKAQQQPPNWKQTFLQHNIQQCESAKNWDNFPEASKSRAIREYILKVLHPRSHRCLPKHIDWRPHSENMEVCSRVYHMTTVTFTCSNCSWHHNVSQSYRLGLAQPYSLSFCPMAQWKAIELLREKTIRERRVNREYCSHVHFIFEDPSFMNCSKCFSRIPFNRHWYSIDPLLYPSWDPSVYDADLP